MVESANGAGASRRGLVDHALERFDEALHVGAESLMRQSNGIARGQRPDRFRQLMASAQAGVTSS